MRKIEQYSKYLEEEIRVKQELIRKMDFKKGRKKMVIGGSSVC